MNAAELADLVASERGLTKTEAKQTVDTVFKAIVDAAKCGAEVSLPGFGKFKVQNTPARQCRNPATAATMQIAASRKLTFALAQAVQAALNSGKKAPSATQTNRSEGAIPHPSVFVAPGRRPPT